MKRARTEAGYQMFSAYIEEVGLGDQIKEICKRHVTTPRDVYLDTRGPSATGARFEVWWWLMKVVGKSTAEIGRLFDRDASSMTHAMKKLYTKADAVSRDVELTTVFGLCHALAHEINENLTESGRNVAKLGTGTEASLRSRARADAGRADRDTSGPGTPDSDE